MEGFDFLSGLEDLKDDVRTTYKYDNSIDPSEYSPEDVDLEVDSFILDEENRDKDGRSRDDNDDDFIEEKEEAEEDIEEEFPDNTDINTGRSRSFEDENPGNNQKKKENKKKINEDKRKRKLENLKEQDEEEKKEKERKNKEKIKEEKKISKNEERKDEKEKTNENIKKTKESKKDKEKEKNEREAMKELLSKTIEKQDNNKENSNKDNVKNKKNIDKEKPLYEQIKEKKENETKKNKKDNKNNDKNKDRKNNKNNKNDNRNNNKNNKNNNKNKNRGNERKRKNNADKNKNINDGKKNESNKSKKTDNERVNKDDKRYILYKNGLYVDKKTGESLTLEELKEIVYSDQDMSIKDDKGKIYDKDKSHNKEYKDELINKIKENKDKKNKEIKNDNIDKKEDKIEEDKSRTKTVIQKGIPVVSSGEKKDNEKKKEELKKIFDDGEEKEKSLVVSEVKTEDDIFVEEALESRKKRPKPPIENTFIADIFLVVEELFENLRFYKLSPATMYKKVLEEDISPADILAHIITASFLGSGLVNVLSHFNILGRSDGVINSMATRKIRFAFTIIAIAPMLKLLLIALLGSVFNIKRDDDRNKYRDTFKYIIINSYSKFLLIFLFNIISVFAPALSIVVLIPIVLKGGLKDIFNVSGIFKKRDVSDLELTVYITLYYIIILAILRYLYLF